MLNIKNKKVIIIIIAAICLLFFVFKSNTTELDSDESVEVDDFKISYNNYPTAYNDEVRIHMRIQNLKDEDNPINPNEVFKLVTDGKEAEMIEFANDAQYIDGTIFDSRMTFALDIVYKTEGNPKSYKLQVHDKKFLKDKIYEYDITPDINEFKKLK
ncbi:hypothetical protein [Staphylococcus sp. IVB6227]|uniref:hypothetical protein n=1 Tax=Staphylococcus sp. IVB6227 TaxID=2989768 RepID=UPI0021D06711|nr:hypothetical protein [Staphylococcus sp. IVB6227]UXR78436.1 hypothetical protein MUA92_00545 [Staphylococcus sp. IVB6227]